MDIRVDTHFVIGNSHSVNEDYAGGGLSPVPWMVVADGCSSSPHSDIGARLLVAAAVEYLGTESEPSATALARHCALKAGAAARLLNLSATVLDATLVAAVVRGGTAKVFMLGDGALCYTDRAGALHLVEVGYSHNAPYYPSYQLDRSRERTYRRQSAARGAVKTVTAGGGTVTAPVWEPTVLNLPVADLDCLLIASDGIGSFRHRDSGEPVPAGEVARGLSAFRGTAGDFLKRRMNRALKQWAGEGVFHEDDLSVGAMVFHPWEASWTSTTTENGSA